MKPKIEWTDYSWNFITGCTQISPACNNCYAKAMTKCLQGIAKNYFDKQFPKESHKEFKYSQCWDKIIFHEEALKDILDKKKYPSGSKVFVNSMSDSFREDVPYYKLELPFAYIDDRRDLIFQFLTKRPKNMIRFFENFIEDFDDEWGGGNHSNMLDIIPYNCWFGVTAENQKMADERIPELLNLREFFGKEIILFVSIEPMLDFMNIRRYLGDWGLDWVIVGGENAAKSRTREMDMYWVNSILEQCKEFNKTFFFNQRGNFYDLKNKENKLELWERKIINCKEFPKMHQIN